VRRRDGQCPCSSSGRISWNLAASQRLATIPAFDVTLHRPEITPEAIRWEAQPGKPAASVRSAVRDAIGDVWTDVPEKPHGFAPHVSIAYSNSDGPAEPVQRALDTVDSTPATHRVRAVVVSPPRDRPRA
jgi:hypothetical protein